MNIKQQLTFNTGHKYTASGQDITVAVLEDGRTIFMDHARDIPGEIEPWDGVYELADHCINEYWGGRYRHCTEARKLVNGNI